MRPLAVIALAWLVPGAALADDLARPSPPAQSSVYRPIRLFDFDERRLGNYDDLPAGWRRLNGPGLPLYSRGRFDDDVGHAAPPSFLLNLHGGNVAYEYMGDELVLAPDSDHLLVAWIRPENLVNAAALVATHLVDAIGEPLYGTEQISALIRGEGWQRVEIPLVVEHPAATAVRIQLWILQDYVWKPLPLSSDPIIRQDVAGRAWFDDIGLYRMPRVRLRFSRADGLVPADAEAYLLIEARGDPEQPWRATCEIADEDGRVHWREELSLGRDDHPPVELHGPPASTLPTSWTRLDEATAPLFRAPIPALPPGLYDAQVTVRADVTTVVQRAVRFAVLPPLPAVSADPELGVNLGLWRGGAAEPTVQWLSELKAGAVKVGLAVGADPLAEGSREYYESARSVVRLLARRGVSVTGVLRSASEDPIGPRLGASGEWASRLGMLLTHLGPTLNSWQLGDETVEVRAGSAWTAQRGATRLKELAPLIAPSQVIIPRDIWSAPAVRGISLSGAPPEVDDSAESAGPAEALSVPGSGRTAGPAPRPAASPSAGPASEAAVDDTGHRISYLIPAELPSAALPRAVAFLLNPEAAPAWLTLAPDAELAELARRIILARAAAPARLYVPAPMELSALGGEPVWQPTAQFIPLRTLLTMLAGRRAVRVMPLGHAAVLIEFRGSGRDCAWAWSRLAGGEEVCFPGASRLRGMDLWGRDVPFAWREGEACLHLGDMPVVLTGFDAGPFLLEQSLTIEPTEFELSAPAVTPVLRLRNPFDEEYRGRIVLSLAPPWALEPTEIEFTLPPGGQREWPLRLTFPARPSAMQQALRISLTDPEGAETARVFTVPLTAGLFGVASTAVTRLVGDTLQIEHMLMNASEQAVSFQTYCQAPGRPRREGQFIRVAPGQTARQVYVLPGGEELVGATLELGLQEIGGERRLFQLVEVTAN